MALQRAWLAQKRNDCQLPAECLQGEEYGHPELVKFNGSDGSFFTVQGPQSGTEIRMSAGAEGKRTSV